MTDNKFNFGKVAQAAKKLREELPVKLANQARNHFSQSFLNQSWEGNPWKEVNRRIPGTNEYKYPKKKDLGRRTRPILIGNGSTKLRRAVANSVKTGLVKWPIVRLVVDLPYARRHNEGLKGMPKRHFMGDSNLLRTMQKKTINTFFKNMFKK